MAEVKETYGQEAWGNSRIKRVFKHENSALVIALVAIIAAMAAVTKGTTVTAANITNVMVQSSVRGIASIGQAFVILTGGIDLSVGGLAVMLSMLGGQMMTSSLDQNLVGHPVSMFLAIPLVLVVGAAFGGITGSFVSRLGMPPLVVTLGMWQITQGMGYQLSGGQAVVDLPEAFAFFGIGWVPVVTFAVVCAVAYFILHYTSFGRSIYAVGGNPASSWLSGIPVKKVLLLVYVIAGFLAGLASIIATSRIMCSSIRTMVGLELDSIAAVAIGGVSLAGGRGTIIGAIIGVAIIGVINNGMSILGAGPAIQQITKGAIIFAAVAIDVFRRR